MNELRLTKFRRGTGICSRLVLPPHTPGVELNARKHHVGFKIWIASNIVLAALHTLSGLWLLTLFGYTLFTGERNRASELAVVGKLPRPSNLIVVITAPSSASRRHRSPLLFLRCVFSLRRLGAALLPWLARGAVGWLVRTMSPGVTTLSVHRSRDSRPQSR